MSLYWSGVNKMDIKSFSWDYIFDYGIQNRFIFYIKKKLRNRITAEIFESLRSKILL